MDEPAAGVLEAAVYDSPQGLVLVHADVLQHAHRHESIELAANVAVIVLDELHLRVQAFRPCAFARVSDLLFGYVVGLHHCAIVLGHVQRQSAPAAARFEHRFAGRKAQLAAHIVELGLLRLLQPQRGVGEIGAGVHHLAIEPELVEIVADIVMMVDIAPRLLLGVAQRTIERRQQLLPDLSPLGSRQRAIDRLEAFDQVTLHLDAFGGVHFAEPEFGVGDELQQCAAVANQNPRDRRLSRARYFLSIPQHEIQGRIAEGVHHPREQQLFGRKNLARQCEARLDFARCAFGATVHRSSVCFGSLLAHADTSQSDPAVARKMLPLPRAAAQPSCAAAFPRPARALLCSETCVAGACAL